MTQESQPVDIAAEGGDATFDVVLAGVRAGVALSETTANLAALFKATPAQIAGLLDGRSHTVKRGCAPATAAIYKEAIEKAGGACELVRCMQATLLVDADVFHTPRERDMNIAPVPAVAPATHAYAAQQFNTSSTGQNQQAAPRAFCAKCGAASPADSAFCTNCGASQAVAPDAVARAGEGNVGGAVTASGIALRLQEVILFEGDVVLLKSKINVSQTDAVITNQRLFVSDGGVVVEKGDVESVTEAKHGWDIKMVFKTRDGRSLEMTAANRQTFVAAAKIFAGQADMSTMPKQTALSDVKNGTAWLAAFGPIIASFVTLIIATLMFGHISHWRLMQVLQALLLNVVLIYLFLRIDHLKLQSQGYNLRQLGLANPATFPLYLFSRAKVFKNGKGPAITWCVLVVIDIVIGLGG